MRQNPLWPPYRMRNMVQGQIAGFLMAAGYRPEWHHPRGFEKWLRRQLRGRSLNLCSGKSKLGTVRLDLDPALFVDGAVKPTIRADMRHLPFRDEVFDSAYMDPPYNLPIAWRDVCGELARVTKVGGKIIVLHILAMLAWRYAVVKRFWVYQFRQSRGRIITEAVKVQPTLTTRHEDLEVLA